MKLRGSKVFSSKCDEGGDCCGNLPHLLVWSTQKLKENKWGYKCFEEEETCELNFQCFGARVAKEENMFNHLYFLTW